MPRPYSAPDGLLGNTEKFGGADSRSWKISHLALHTVAFSAFFSVSLKSVAADLGIEFLHHDAGEDARVVAEIIIRASLEHSLDVAGWAERVRKPITSSSNYKSDLRRDGNVDGPLYGEIVVLTGGFDLPKAEQANLAAYAGCEVANSVTKKTTLVVVGDDRFARGERSGKWKRAEELARQNLSIRIMSESDFRALI